MKPCGWQLAGLVVFSFTFSLIGQVPARTAVVSDAPLAKRMLVTVSGSGPTRVAAHAAAKKAAGETSPRYEIKKETYEQSGANWVCTMEIIVDKP